MKKYLLASCLTLAAVPAWATIDCATLPECAELGFTQSITNCSGFLSLKCPFDAEQVYCGDVCGVGAILYSDGSCSFTKQSGKTAVGVVFDADNRYVVSLNTANKEWGPHGTDITAVTNCTDSSAVKTSCGADGKTLTKAFVNSGFTSATNYASSYCYNLTEGDKTAGSWWLPSMKELQTLYDNKTGVNAGLTAAGGANVDTGGYWSSVEVTGYYAWALNMGSGITSCQTIDYCPDGDEDGLASKANEWAVRCITSF